MTTVTAQSEDRFYSMPQIRAVILDYGEVISHTPDPAVISAMAGVFGLPEGQFRSLYSSFRHGYDRGDVSGLQYWTEVALAAKVDLSRDQVNQLRQWDVAMWSKVHPAMLRWASNLRAAGVKTAVLSNMHDDMVQHLRSNAAWITDFDCLTLSSTIHMAKPDAEIFWHCLDCLRVEPHESMFIDDREPNVRAAGAIGINGIVANSPAQLRSALQSIGFQPLPE
jgi:putative hydrolase of the HAD superfamily